MRIAMVGTGYVGLVSGACFAELGHLVTCIDSDCEKIGTLQRGGIPIFEPGLPELVSRNLQEGRLSFSTDIGVVDGADAVFIAVGTPTRPGNGHADLSQVKLVAQEIAPYLPSNVVVVLKSTVPIGTADAVERIISEMRPELAFTVVSNPEFLRAGAALEDFMHPDRVVVGADHPSARTTLAEIYRPLMQDNTPLVFTSRRSAELIKYTANTMLATRIALINEIADLCEEVGADVADVSRGVGLDKRIGPDFLAAGPGFGGSCFPKDVLALLAMAEEHHVPMRIAESVLVANEVRKRSLARRVSRACDGALRGKSVALLGLTFKANTDDMRESPAIALVAGLGDMDAKIRAYEPAGIDQAKKVLGNQITYCTSAYEAARGTEVIVLVTDWPEFRTLDFDRLKRLMRIPVIVDLRNAYRANELTKHGFRYCGIGMTLGSSMESLAGPQAPPSAPRRSPGRTNGHGGAIRKHKPVLTRTDRDVARSS